DLQSEVVDMALAARGEGVVALGLAGDERMDETATFQPSFARAEAAGLPGIPHTGELSGPDKIWETIRLLKPRRLQHGVRAIEDPSLVAYLRKQRIGIDLCPTSNIRLGVYPDYASHPLRQLWDEGLLVTVNSDDPPLFNTDLNNEYEILVTHFGFTADELAQASLNGVAASVLPEDEKAKLEAEFQEEIARLRAELL
ncbi:MAG: adenosine deaminase family protein, partial [Nitrososphaerales archaeon]